MADPDRLDLKMSADVPAGADHRASLAAQIEALLLDGLDRYFAHQYEDAIHIWTRVLFLDRENARARAYIDRARGAVAERQRLGEELLQSSQERLDAGDAEAARTSLRQAVAHGADDARAAAQWLRIERRERARPTASIAEAPAGVAPAVPARRSRVRARFVTAAVLVIGVTVAAVLADIASRAWLLPATPADVVVEKPDLRAPVVLSSADVALTRARSLYARGRLAEALLALDRVPSTAQNRADADALRRDIQRLLLATAEPRQAPAQGPHS